MSRASPLANEAGHRRSTQRAGYGHPDYAASLAEFGTPRLLPRSGGWILERPIEGALHRDAMGCYPLFTCADWVALEADLDDLSHELVCISLVADPFGAHYANLQRCFEDRLVSFKQHFVADLRRSPREFVTPHHRYYARRALRRVEVERCVSPRQHLDEWVHLYAELTRRRHLTGIKAFSREAFAIQLEVPGIVMLRALHQGTVVAAHLWYVAGDVAYSHLAATNELGYQLMAPYALHWFALETLAAETRWLNLAGAAGLETPASDGLAQFKKGWSSDTRTAYFCGRILDRARYDELASAHSATETDYFPAYRRGELG